MKATFQAYREARDANDSKKARHLRDALILDGEPLIARMAKKVERGDFDDLMQAGRIAYAKAIEQYEASKGATFVQFAKVKINTAFDREVITRRGQVTATSRWTPMPKSVKRQEQAFVSLHGRLPTATELGVDAEDLEAWRTPSYRSTYVEDLSDGASPAEIAVATTDTHHVLSKKIRRAIGEMSPQEQRVLLGRVMEDLDFAVIGEREGLLRDTTTRIYTRAIAKLREVLRTE